MNKLTGRTLTFTISPYHLNTAYKNSYTEVAQGDIPKFFKALAKFMKNNPHMVLEDLRMNLITFEASRGHVYVFEGVWYDENEDGE